MNKEAEQTFLEMIEAIENLENKSWEKLKEIDSPMIKQYLSFKEEYKDHIVLFQLGEFYETYYDDAETLSSKLNVKLTKKTIGGVDIPMSGVPAKSGILQANQLAKLGFKVAIINEKKNEKGKTERFLSQTITPSTISDDDFLSKDEHLYMMTAYQMKNELGVVLFDTLSGEVESRVVSNSEHLKVINQFAIFDLISRYQPKEVKIYLTKEWESEMMHKLKNIPSVQLYKLPYFYDEIKPIVQIHKEKYFKDKFVPYSVIAAHYFMIKNIEKNPVSDVTLRPIHFIEERDYLYLHKTALKGLEILENAQDGKKDKTLFHLLDHCVTPKGSRLLKKWIQEPLIDKNKIEQRYAIVEYFLKEKHPREFLRTLLENTNDIERTIGRFEKGQYKDHELVQFLETFETFKDFLYEIVHELKLKPLLKPAEKRLQTTQNILSSISLKISKESIIAPGYDKKFDELKHLKENGLELIEKHFEEEKEKTGIKTMKLEHDKNIGYYFEVTKSHYSKIPDYFMERKELSNKKKLVTNELENLKVRYLEALEEYNKVYQMVIRQIVADILAFKTELYRIIDFIAFLDVAMSLSTVAEKYGYQKPIINDNGSILMKNAKHPLLQAFSYQKVISNQCKLLNEEIQIITGPNMGGKSTYLKMVALIVIMAQIGSFVPAELSFSPVDRILLRMGASDNLLNNQSTFMLEMEEVAYILYHATENSLVLMDELGRGTSTSDGIRIAYAVIHHLHEKIKSKTICSTHYHELTELENDLRNVTNYHAEAVEKDDGVELTFKIIPGGSSKSFGLEVAKRVGLPNEIIDFADKLSEKF